MATTTVSPRPARATRTTIWLKLLMAVSGLLFIFYVLMHMYGNLKVLSGEEPFNSYALHLRTMLTPILPVGGFLWLFRALLVVALAAHAYSAFALWSRSSGARKSRYAVIKTAAQSTTMRWGGVFILLFLVWHLLQFTMVKFNVNTGQPVDRENIYQLVVASFQVWWVVLIYVLAMLALGLHLAHGTFSAQQTLGWTQTEASYRRAKMTAHVVAGIVVVGFLIPPFAILFGFVKLN